MKKCTLILSVCCLLPIAGCKVGPVYKTPPAILASAFKETTPATSADGWKPGQPSNAQLKGDWWIIFGDAKLNELESQVNTANQTLKSAEANFRAARAEIVYARSSKAPTVGTAPSIGTVRNSANLAYFPASLANDGEGNFTLPFDLDYEIECREKLRVREIFERHGEPGFRELETDALHTVLESASAPTVIALGGGTFVQPQNADLLRAYRAHVVFLDVAVEQDADAFYALHAQRLPSYRRAGLIVNAGPKTAEQIAREIVALLRLIPCKR